MAEAGDDWSPGDDDDLRAPRLPSLAGALPPVRWSLALLGGLACGSGAAWEWWLHGPTRLAVVGAVAAAVWVVFAAGRFALGRAADAEPGAAADGGAGFVSGTSSAPVPRRC